MTAGRLRAVTVPKWGMAMDEGTVVAWHVEEGASVAKGAELLDVESTKIANAIEAGADGVLRRRVAAVGATLPVGGLLAVIAAEDASDEEIDRFVAGFAVEAARRDPDADEPAPRFAEADGRRVRYVVRGEGGEPVVLVHGFGGDMNAWMFNHGALAADRAVLALDLPGHGGSSKDVGDGGLDAPVSAVAAVMDAAEAARCHLVGHSLGGAAALRAALDRPERVATLTLIASAGLGPEIDGDYVAGFVEARRRKEMKALAERLFADPSLVTRAFVEGLLRSKRIDGVDAALAAIASRLFPDGRQTLDLASRASSLDLPIQVLWGAGDAIVPIAHARAIEGAAIRVLDGAGHMPMMERASETNRLIAAFAR